MTTEPFAEQPGAPRDPTPAGPGVTGAQGVAGQAAGHQAAAPPLTGLDPVDRVLAREADIARLPVTGRAAAYEELHTELERILSEDPAKLPRALLAVSSPGTAPDAARDLSGAPRPGETPRPPAEAPDTGEGRSR